MVPPGLRVPGALYLVDMDEYFVIHAPRQSGKTTALWALARDVNATGERVALVFSCEQASAWGEGPEAINALLDTITEAALSQGLSSEHMPPSSWLETFPAVRLQAGLSAWSRTCPSRWSCSLTRSTRSRGGYSSASCVSCGPGIRQLPGAAHFRPRWRCAGCGISVTTRPTPAVIPGPSTAAALSTAIPMPSRSPTSLAIRSRSSTPSTQPRPGRSSRRRRSTGRRLHP